MNHTFVATKVFIAMKPKSFQKIVAAEDRNILTCAPTMAHVPKSINRGFQDKTRVPTFRGLNLENKERLIGRLASTLGRFSDPKEDD